MSTAKKTDNLKTFDIDHQDASVDIWDKKYRLKSKDGSIIDETIDETFQRIAKAIVEARSMDSMPGAWI